MRRVLATGAVMAVTIALTSCSPVSQEERSECQRNGGAAVTDQFPYEKGDDWKTRETGVLYYCKLQNGSIGEVYNEKVDTVATGLGGDTDDNRKIFEDCTALGGLTYRTEESQGRTSAQRFVCVYDGAVRQLI